MYCAVLPGFIEVSQGMPAAALSVRTPGGTASGLTADLREISTPSIGMQLINMAALGSGMLKVCVRGGRGLGLAWVRGVGGVLLIVLGSKFGTGV